MNNCYFRLEYVNLFPLLYFINMKNKVIYEYFACELYYIRGRLSLTFLAVSYVLILTQSSKIFVFSALKLTVGNTK
jgi:hypothetical protein